LGSERVMNPMVSVIKVSSNKLTSHST
jgi:hypothetical protein